MPFSLFLALTYLKPKRSFLSVVTLISVLGVLLGVAILVIVLSVMTGFDNMWREKILSFKPHVTVQGHYRAIDDDDALAERIAGVAGVTGVAPSVQTRVLLQYDGRIAAPIAMGIPSDRIGAISALPAHLIAGAYDVEDEGIVVGVDLAASMRLHLGDEALVYSPMNAMAQDEWRLPEALTVRGIFDMGMRDFDGGFVFVSLSTARDLVDLDRGAHSMLVMTADPFRVGRTVNALAAEIGDAYRITTWQEEDRVLFEALRHEKTMMFILLVFITIVAIFCVTNTLIVITVQKTSEIGLLKALGFAPGRIMAAFVWHGWIQCLIGIGAGVGAGLLVLRNMTGIVAVLTSVNVQVFPKAIYGLSEIPWDTSPGEIARIALFVMVFCTLSSLLPAWRAARLDPVDALRAEGA